MTAADSPTCTLLEWDSRFFGLRIGRVQGDRFTPLDAARAVAWGRENSIDCLFALIEAEHTSSVRSLEGERFELADVRLTLDREVDGRDVRPVHPVRDAEPDDRESLLSLARISHGNTRFTEDRRFDPLRSAELYARWVSNAFDEQDALVLVPQLLERGAGYLTLHNTSKPEAHLGVLAIAEQFRGRGLGEALLTESIRRLHQRGAKRVTVATQGRSSAVVRLYERCGFKARACQFWYHRWFER